MSGMSGMLRDKVVVVTGAGGGIGLAVAQAVAAEGGLVVVNDVGATLSGATAPGSDGAAAAAAREIEAAGGRAVADAHDVASHGEAVIATAIAAYGRIDAVVNNAGILRDGFFHRMEAQDFEAVLRVHLHGAFAVSRAAAPHFKAQGSGAFVHMTSTSGLVGNRAQANYAAAKLGIMGLSRSIALDMARFGTRSNCVAPFAWSRMIASIKAETDDERRRVERLKAMRPEKVAALVAYLVSDAAEGVTGQVFAARGNELMVMSQPRPVRSVHRGEDAQGTGWSPRTIADHAMPALRAGFTPLEVSADVFNWDPV